MTTRKARGRGLVLAALAVLSATTGIPPVIRAQGASRGAVIAVRGATILTVTKGTIQNGTLIARDGKIVAVGSNLPIPGGAEVIDATAKFVSRSRRTS